MIEDCDKKIARGKARVSASITFKMLQVEDDIVRKRTLDPMIVEEAKRIDSQIQAKMALVSMFTVTHSLLDPVKTNINEHLGR